ncbi:polynucleotide kinase-phosphatase [Glutamicibacter protophormiae]|uniref:Polynucleotide kinase-phosphatase n=1 Tax=Glutamicibacter protophormiae TaxID=37930 RepID=A0ABS4XTH4_GLUPR|nr:polynucleotide kinase-phosphatase [Glutamicibacter protophormiae]MBP2399043.1 polynucleotide kinase-phosphatase [Glutamicibacter protophormiae]GGL95869.1 polynucleotide kinase-phosphatase [Glutamicibacter protophormiae]
MSEFSIPETGLVVLVGVSGSGKSSFAAKHFGRFEVLSSDYFRGLVGNDETDQSVTAAAFDALHYVAGKRLDAGLLTVVDATSVQQSARQSLIELARSHDALATAIVLDVPVEVCLQRNEGRGERRVPKAVIDRQHLQLRRSLKSLRREGFTRVHVLSSPQDIDGTAITRHKLLNDFRDQHGPFDVIGDVHGCLEELVLLLAKLGYDIVRDRQGRAVDAFHPNRRAVFVGDLVDRGPDSPGVLRLVMGMVAAGHALAVPGNHEDKLVRALRGAKVTLNHGLDKTLEQLEAEGPEFKREVQDFCRSLVSHLVLDDGKLVVAHAGLIEKYHGRASQRVRAFALYGQVTGEVDEYGLPVRYPWARDYRGDAAVLYGHTPVTEVAWINNTACLDTGCAFGGQLSALRYPEREVVAVEALAQYAEPMRPLESPHGPQREPGVLSMEDVTGPLHLKAGERGSVKLSAAQAAGALETMSRFATDPRWLRYLPPTMSPADSSARPGYLEHPDEAFAYFRKLGIGEVICEEKHTGSRAVLLLACDPARFDAPAGWLGALHTRTGREFLEPEAERALLQRAHAAAEAAGLWDELGSDWVILDGELLPWSLKAESLIKDTYASVGAAAVAATSAAADLLERAAGTGLDLVALLERTRERSENAQAFRQSYRRYVGDKEQVRFATFQVLASEGRTYETSDHGWHMGIARKLAVQAPDLFKDTAWLRVSLDSGESTAQAVQWWEELTASGGEGMVVKPWLNLTRGARGWVQPGIKVRGREYLHIIYGADYLAEANLQRLKQRATDRKRSRALQEYLLGLEALRMTAAGEPLWKVHQMVFGVLALESEPLDPRL